MIFKIGIIGCGHVGKKRAENLGHRGKLFGCYDIDKSKSTKMAVNSSSKVFESIEEMINCDEIDIVIICTLHQSLAKIASKFLNTNKNILIEKPAGIDYQDVNTLKNKIIKTNSKVHIGFNHRYHRAIIKAKEIVSQGHLGELMFIRGCYGHGGRLGYENEWRFNTDISGGGELIDQGPHLIDLSQWFFKEELQLKSSIIRTFYWDTKAEDNAFLMLSSRSGKIASLHVSCTEWKNTFLFEIYGKKGKLSINGLGGSYGIEKLTFYKMLPEMGPPETTTYEFPMLDNSWLTEINEFYDDIIQDRAPKSNIESALSVHKIIKEAYAYEENR